MDKNDSELIWENYITANWGYQNYNNPTTDKYSNISAPSKDSFFDAGKTPTSPTCRTSYAVSSDEESSYRCVYVGTIHSDYGENYSDIYVLISYNLLYSKKFNDNVKKGMIMNRVNKFLTNNNYNLLYRSKDKFYKNDLQIHNVSYNKLIKNGDIVIDFDTAQSLQLKQEVNNKDKEPIQTEFKFD